MSLNFPELFIMEKYAKIRFKSKGSPCYFPSSRGQKTQNITKIDITKDTIFVYIIGFVFCSVPRIKTDLHNKYMI